MPGFAFGKYYISLTQIAWCLQKKNVCIDRNWQIQGISLKLNGNSVIWLSFHLCVILSKCAFPKQHTPILWSEKHSKKMPKYFGNAYKLVKSVYLTYKSF